MELTPIDPIDLTVDELEAMSRSTARSHDEVRPVHICKEAMQGKCLVWRFIGDEPGEFGIIVTEGIKRFGGAELFIRQLAGSGMIKHTEFIFKTLEDHAKTYRFRWMGGITVRPLARVLKNKLGFEQKAIMVIKEIDYGRE